VGGKVVWEPWEVASIMQVAKSRDQFRRELQGAGQPLILITEICNKSVVQRFTAIHYRAWRYLKFLAK